MAIDLSNPQAQKPYVVRMSPSRTYQHVLDEAEVGTELAWAADRNKLEEELNQLAERGYRVVATTPTIIILEHAQFRAELDFVEYSVEQRLLVEATGGR